MRQAMARAEVGDDVYGEDPTVARLEERVAGLFGHEAALFMPTGSMANVLAVRSVVQAGREVLCEASAHIARAELGAHGAYTGLTMRTWIHPRGQVDLRTIETMFAPDMGPFFVATAAISVENTHNFAGGAVLPLQDLRDLREYATAAGAAVHMDGARIWNAHVATGVPLAEYGAVADVLSVCLSKGLGAPVGSLVVGSRDAIDESRIWRKRMGGGMRRSASSPRAGCTRWTTTSSGSRRTTRTPGCWPRPAASTRPASTRTSWWCRARTRSTSWPPPGTPACWSPRSARRRS